MNDYKTLLELISEPTDNYYPLLLQFHSAILARLMSHSKQDVASDLGLSASKFSTAVQFIQAYSLLEGANNVRTHN